MFIGLMEVSFLLGDIILSFNNNVLLVFNTFFLILPKLMDLFLLLLFFGSFDNFFLNILFNIISLSMISFHFLK